MASHKLALGLLVVCIIVIAYFTTNLRGFGVMAVSKIFLETRGSGAPGQVLQNGNWRILASTDVYGSITQFLTFNDTTAKQYAVGSDYPADTLIQGSVTFGIFQNQLPFWHIPFTKVKDITIYPEVFGAFDYSKAGQSIPAKTVSIWRSNLANKELLIPFSVGIIKTAGSKLGSLTTDYPGAVKVPSPQGDYWQFQLSYKNIAEAQYPAVINWYNPQDTSQKVKMTLQWTVGGSEYDWPYDWIVITDQNGGNILSSNVFNSYDLTTIEQQLNYQFNDPYAYARYWFGGGGVYTGHGETTTMFGGQVTDALAHPLSWWGGTSPSPIITIPALPPMYIGELMIYEGYAYDTSKTNTAKGQQCPYEFPGWYVPAPGNTEGTFGVPPYWESHRLPIEAPVINDAINTVPVGLSVVNYLTNSAPRSDVNKLSVQRVNPDVWGQGMGGSVGDNAGGLGVALPGGARKWLYTLDISTELVDCVVVQENYIHVSARDFSVDRTIVAPGSTATVTVTLDNDDNYAGGVMQGFSVPTEVAGSCSITGGGGATFAAGEKGKIVNLGITNTGNLDEDTNAVFTYRVTNQEGTVTAEKQVELTFQAGLGVEDTKLTITCLEADTNIKIEGLLVTVYYGVTGSEEQHASTEEGVVAFNLGQAGGAVTVTYSDPRGYYQPKTTYYNIERGKPNTKQEFFSHGTITQPFPEWAIWAIVVSILFVSVIAIARRKKKPTPKTMGRRKPGRRTP